MHLFASEGWGFDSHGMDMSRLDLIQPSFTGFGFLRDPNKCNKWAVYIGVGSLGCSGLVPVQSADNVVPAIVNP